MEDFGSFIIMLIAAIAAIVNASKKNKKQSASASRPTVSTVRPQPAAAAPKKTAPPPPAAAPVSMASMLPREEKIPQLAQPQVHAHLEPDCETHDAPTAGSLNYVSTEGKDPCHEEQLTYDREPLPNDADQSGLTFDWSGEAMVKAFVMQEVLTRPCDRKRR